MAAANLDFTTAATAYTALTTRSTCGAMPFVVAGNPDGSLLVDKIASATPRCGGVMPPGAQLCADDINSVRAWVQAGAMND